MEPMFEATAPLSTYEQASITLQQASVTAQQTGNEIVFWIGITQATVALLVGLIQAGVVGWGIRYMIRMGERREQQHAERHAETMEAFRLQAAADRTQHMETLEALRQQGDAFRQQGDAFRQQNDALRQQGDALRQQGDALRTLIERTAPSPA